MLTHKKLATLTPRRCQSFARELNSRLWLIDGRLMVVHGQPKFEALTRLRNWSSATPEQFGFESTCAVTTTWMRHRLAMLRKYKWLLSDPQIRRQHRRRIADWQQEIAELEERAAFVADVRSRCDAGQLIGSGPILTTDDESRFEQTCAELQQDNRAIPAAWKPTMRILLWMSGAEALARLSDSLRPILPGRQALETRELLHRVHRIFNELDETAKRDRELALHLWRQEFEKWPHWLTWRLQLSVPPTTRGMRRSLSRQRNICQGLYHRQPDVLPVHIVAATAALIACDGSTATIPYQLFTREKAELFVPRAAFLSIVGLLRDLSVLPRYDEFLVGLREFPELVSRYSTSALLGFLTAGTSLQHLQWIADEHLDNVFDNFAFDAGAVCDLADLLAVHDARMELDSLSEIFASLESPADVDFYESVLGWLRLLPESSATTPLMRRVRQVLAASTSRRFRADCRERVRVWARPPRRLKNRMPLDDIEAPTEVETDLARIAWYQRLAGRSVKLPRKLKKSLGFQSRRQREIQTLRAQAAQGQLAPSALARLNHLESDCQQTNLNKIAQTVQDSSCYAAVDALSMLLSRAASDWWEERYAGVDAPAVVSHIAEIANWLDGRDEAQRESFTELLVAWQTHGASYRQHLKHNQSWLKQASERGLQVNVWLAKRDRTLTIDDRPFEVSKVSAPTVLLRMGSIFQTCLTLDDGMNSHALLPNAYDANKAVLYVYDRQSASPVARRLVGISESFELVGFTTYCNGGDELTDDRCSRALDEFCGTWAFEVGIPLSDQGDVPELSHEWYDDGETKWSDVARRAYRDAGCLQPDRPGSADANTLAIAAC